MKKNILVKSLLMLSMSFIMACSQSGKNAIVKQGIGTIDGSLESSSNRIEMVNQALSVVDSNGNFPLVFQSNLLNFEHMSTVKSPSVSVNDSRKLRATSVVKRDSNLFISYMMEGSEFIGSLDIVDVASAPIIKSSYKFTNVKISDVKVKGNVAYLVGAKKNQGAALIIMDITNLSAPKFVKYFIFPGDIATSLDIRQNQLVISSAQNGGLTYFDLENPLAPKYLGFELKDNALFVKAMLTNNNDSSDLSSMVLGGLNKTEISFKGDTLPLAVAQSDSPSRFTVMGPMVYATSAAGITVSEISDRFNGFVRTIPLDGKANGIAQLDQKLYVAAGEKGLKYFDAEEPGMPVELGFFNFEDLGSANNVWVERMSSTEKLIILADGQSGVRLIKEELVKNSSNVVIKINAKSQAYLGENAKLAVMVNGVQVGDSLDISPTSFESYSVSSPNPLHFGDEVKVVYFNDEGPRNVSIAYVKVGEDFFYPWVNNYFYFTDMRVFNNDSDNILMEEGGYYKFIF